MSDGMFEVGNVLKSATRPAQSQLYVMVCDIGGSYHAVVLVDYYYSYDHGTIIGLDRELWELSSLEEAADAK